MMRGRGGVALVVIVVAASGLIIGLAEQAPAAAFTPTRFDDPAPDGCNPGDCSLREAIITANSLAGPDTVALAAGTYTLSIPGTGEDAAADGDLDITDPVGTTILGSVAGGTTIDGNGPVTQEGVLHVPPSGSLTMSNLTIRGGDSPGYGGGLHVEDGTAVIESSTFTVNHSNTAGGALERSGGSLTVRNSTVTGNSTDGYGGGIDNVSGAPPQQTTIENSTITGNTANVDVNPTGEAGGIYDGTGTVTLSNTIVAGNTDASAATKEPDCHGTLTSAGHNIVGVVQPGCTFDATVGDQQGTSAAPLDPKLAPLANNGGPTSTHALLAGSPALDAGGGCLPTDQRGAPRTGTCDIGAYELAFCKGVTLNRVGASGNDSLTGTEGTDGFLAQGGNDRVAGLGGNDAVCLGDGNDRASGGSGHDQLLGEKGNDRLRGQGGKDRLKGGPGKDVCSGGPGRKDRATCEIEKQVP